MIKDYYWWIVLAIISGGLGFSVVIFLLSKKFSLNTSPIFIGLWYLWIIVGVINFGIWLHRVFSRQVLLDLCHLAAAIFFILIGIVMLIKK